MNKFIPIKYLDPSDVEIFKEARNGVIHAKNIDELSRYESILDNLLRQALMNYKDQIKKTDQDNRNPEPVTQ